MRNALFGPPLGIDCGGVMAASFRTAEFFAGMGLVRQAVEAVNGAVVFANDIEPSKQALYAANFPAGDFRLGDIRAVRGDDVPDVDLATASFPCTDLSLAGNRAGLAGTESGMFWEFARVIREMGSRSPAGVLLENVPSFATSNGGADLEAAIRELNDLGYVCDLLVVNARHFVAQSRPRLFVACARSGDWPAEADPERPTLLRPKWLRRFCAERPDLGVRFRDLPMPEECARTLADVVEPRPPDDSRWWEPERVDRFRAGMAQLQYDRLQRLIRQPELSWRTAYRRTRNGWAVWEIRRDEISGCLRTARGGSSKQALIEAGGGELRVRWMTPREYARLQGVEDSYCLDAVAPNQALFGLGDAVCVPAVAWVLRHAVVPGLQPGREGRRLALASV